MFVDDEKVCHVFVNLIISNFTNYKIISAYSGSEALALANRYKELIALVITDIMMPDINGYDLYRIMKNNKCFVNTPFIFQSGLSSQEKELKKYIDNNTAILYKPYDYQDLINLISKTIT